MSSARLIRFNNQGLALWKWSLSLGKYDWKLSDYPVRIRQAEVEQSSFRDMRFKPSRYVAYVVNWPIIGNGDTPKQATGDLNVKFESIKRKRALRSERLPRPGVRVPIEFAPAGNVNAHEELSKDFVQRILGVEWAWISDESSLWEFHGEVNNDLLHGKIRAIYGVDVSDIDSAKLWEIFQRIENAKTLLGGNDSLPGR